VWPKPREVKTSSNVYFIDPDNFNFILDSKSPQECQLIDLAFKRYFTLTFDQSCLKWSPSPSLSSSFDSLSRKEGSQQEKRIKDCHDKNGKEQLCPQDITPNEVEKQLTNLTISFHSCEPYPHEEMNEKYSLTVGYKNNGGLLFANTVWGILRGLESFSQLVYQDDHENDEENQSDFLNSIRFSSSDQKRLFKVNETAIHDFPRYSYRGVMIDTSRHYIPVNVIKQNLDAMVYNKFNVFHWHLTDDQSFPYVSRRFPEMHLKGAFNAKTHIYSQEMIQDIIEYARLRGIRVIPEFDTPGHTRSWGNSHPHLLTVCYDNTSKLPNGDLGAMNPIEESTYEFIEEFFKEVAQVFPDSTIHLGGDEVGFSFDCWKSNPKIIKWMKRKGMTEPQDLQNYYMKRLIKIITKLDKKIVLCQEIYDDKVPLDGRNVAVQVWLGHNDEWRNELANITKDGIKAILSSPFYLNIIKYGPDWSEFYVMDPRSFNGTFEQKKLAIGGSVCMWGEYVDGAGIMPRTWPRASAVAERLWSAEHVNDTTEAGPRIKKMQCLMQRRGLRVDPIDGPGFCPCDHLFE